jgi:aspartate kinase
MNVIVQKYGGSSLKDTERLRTVASRIVERKRQGVAVVVVVSAMGDTTDKLAEMARTVTPEPSRRELDMLLTVGERTTMALLSMAIHALGEEAISLTGSQCGILTTHSHSRARIMEVRPFRVRDELDKGHIVIVAGYQGTSYKREITTLGRGGSDVTALALAGALEAEACEIYSDVDGVYTADPQVISEAKRIDELSYDEAENLARAGATVLHRDALAWAKRHGVALYARSSFVPEGQGGTVIRLNPPERTRSVVAVVGRRDLVRVLSGNIEPVEDVLSEVTCISRTETREGGEWLFSKEDVAETLCEQLSSQGADVDAACGSVTVIGSGLGEDNEAYGAIRAHFSGLPSRMGTFGWMALVPVDRVDELTCALHRTLIESES